MLSSHGANTKQMSLKYSINEKDIIDLSSNVNIFMPYIDYELISKNIQKNINKYPDIEYRDLKYNISKVYDMKQDYIYVGNGAIEVIYDVISLDCFQKIAICNPTFSEYERACTIYKKSIIDIDINVIDKINEYMDLQDFKKLYDIPDIIMLCNPNNPTGNIKNIRGLLKFCKKNNIFLFADETFIDFMNNEDFSLQSEVNNFDNIIVLNAVTKFFAMTGVRLGYAFCSNMKILNDLNSRKKSWNINILAQEVMKQLINIDKRFYIGTKNYYESERERLYKNYAKNGINITKTYAPFFCINLDDSVDAKHIQEMLLKEDNILVRLLDNYKNISSNSIRIAIKEQYINDKVLESIVSKIL